MHHGVQLISNWKFLALSKGRLLKPSFLFLVFLLAGCELFPQKKSPHVADNLNRPFQQEFIASYEAVWRAAQISVRYPISLNNMDTGQLETDWIRALEGFIPPDQKKAPSSGMRYKIILTLVRGRKANRPSVRVTLKKLVERQRDFFAEPESIATDGLEEKVILYRMERELIIQEALKKVPDSK
jgi:hypothetical protein